MRTYNTQIFGRLRHMTAVGSVRSGGAWGVTTSAGLATTYTGLVLSNPNLIAGQTAYKNISLLRVGLTFGAGFSAAASVGLMCGFSATDTTHTSAALIYNRSVTQNAVDTTSIAKLDSAATLQATPSIRESLFGALTGLPATQIGMPGVYDIDGAIEIPPGGFVAIYTSIAGPASGMNASFVWQEITNGN